MRRLIAILAAVLLLGASAIAGAGQDASPPAGTPVGTGASDPAIGETITYVDAEGAAAANVTVDAVERDWQGYVEGAEPDEGIEYVAFTITIENVSEASDLLVSDVDFSLQDGAGFLWAVSYVDASEDAEVSPLAEELGIGPQESATFLIVFEVLPGQALGHLFWQPDTGRLVTLAALEGI